MLKNLSLSIIIIVLSIFNNTPALSCSMYKLTANGKTMVGCNEDAWRTQSRIWFENGKEGEYGAAFTGSRALSSGRFVPQSGMNTAGLAYSRLATYYPEKENFFDGKKSFNNEAEFLSSVLHKCSNVREVQQYMEAYDRTMFNADVFIYIDSSGDYLVVEPYEFVHGDEPNYVLSNFCPTITDNESARKLDRYRNGEDYLALYNAEANLAYCRALSDTMHVSRSRNQDGTLLTSIWDTKDGLVNLFFYHSYDKTVQFNIEEELNKGDHEIDIIGLFPENEAFNKLKTYITPFNTPMLRIGIVLIGGFLVFLTLVYLLMSFRKNELRKYFWALAFMNLLLTAFFVLLVTNINIYYFDAPYKHYASTFISSLSFIPFILLIAFAPLLINLSKYLRRVKKDTLLKSMMFLNNSIYLLALFGFVYWGFFDVFN